MLKYALSYAVGFIVASLALAGSCAAGQNAPAQGYGLVMFWRADCAPCRKEMLLLPRFAQDYPGLPITLVSLEGQEAYRLLSSLGDKKQMLPFSVMRHEDGSVCARHYGMLGTDMVSRWVETC